MIPIHLDPAGVQVALVGNGPLAVRRLEWLRNTGGMPAVFADAPSPELVAAAGSDLHRGLPGAAALQALDVLWIADLAEEAAAALFAQARAHKVLVNVEDVKPLCQFHVPAIVRRGRLTVSIGTGGASPAVASAVRQRIDDALPSAWTGVLDAIAADRDEARAAGIGPAELNARARARLAAEGL